MRLSFTNEVAQVSFEWTRSKSNNSTLQGSLASLLCSLLRVHLISSSNTYLMRCALYYSSRVHQSINDLLARTQDFSGPRNNKHSLQETTTTSI